MKDYIKIFNDENKDIFYHKKMIESKARKQEQKAKNWIKYPTVMVIILLSYLYYKYTFVEFYLSWVEDLYEYLRKPAIVAIVTVINTIVLFVITYYILYLPICMYILRSKKKLIEHDNKVLETKAKEFATAIYLEDKCLLLAKYGKVTPELKNYLKTFFFDHYCFFDSNKDEFNPPDFFLNEMDEQIVVMYNSYITIPFLCYNKKKHEDVYLLQAI